MKITNISQHYSFVGGLLDLLITMKIYLNYALLCCVMLLLHLCTTESRVIHLDNDDTDNDEDLPLHSITNGRGRNLLSSYNQSMYISKYIVVDKDGNGNFKTVQEAVDSVPDYNKRWVYIQINAGLYM